MDMYMEPAIVAAYFAVGIRFDEQRSPFLWRIGVAVGVSFVIKRNHLCAVLANRSIIVTVCLKSK